MRGHTKSLDANDKLIQTRSHVRNAIASRERQVVMRKVKSTIHSNSFFLPLFFNEVIGELPSFFMNLLLKSSLFVFQSHKMFHVEEPRRTQYNLAGRSWAVLVYGIQIHFCKKYSIWHELSLCMNIIRCLYSVWVCLATVSVIVLCTWQALWCSSR